MQDRYSVDILLNGLYKFADVLRKRLLTLQECTVFEIVQISASGVREMGLGRSSDIWLGSKQTEEFCQWPKQKSSFTLFIRRQKT